MSNWAESLLSLPGAGCLGGWLQQLLENGAKSIPYSVELKIWGVSN